jgi:hypothetical protein
MKIRKSWIVLRHNARGAGGSSFEWYDERADANEQALRMAARNPGVRYVILEAVGTVMVPLPETEIEEIQ